MDVSSQQGNSPTQQVYLSISEEHHRIKRDLDCTLIVSAIAPATLLSDDALLQALIERYGGQQQQWRLAKVQGGTLVRIPEGFHPDELINDSPYWELIHSCLLSPWQCWESSRPMGQTSRELICITGFPIDFWHPCFFRQATAKLGNLVGVNQEALRGEDRSQVQLMLECAENMQIPTELEVGHNGVWSKCKIHRQTGAEASQPPLPPRPPDQDDQRGRDNGWQQRFAMSHVPLWRRRPLSVPLPAVDVPRQGAPSAQASVQRRWSMRTGNRPGPQRKILLSQRLTLVNQVYSEGGSEESIRKGRVSHYKTPFSHKRAKRGFIKIPHAHKQEGNVSTIQKEWENVAQDNRWIGNSQSRDTPRTQRPSAWGYRMSLRRFQIPKHLQIKQGGARARQFLFLPPPLIHPRPTSQQPKLQHPQTSLSKQKPMANFTDDDEALIQKFIGLQTQELTAPIAIVPHNATSSTNWEECLLLKVVTDRRVIDTHFADAMLTAWGADPDTKFRQVAQNCFLVEFCSEEDRYKASLKGPWTFRGDLVATRKVSSFLDLNPNHISLANIWFQFYNVPLGAFTEEGLLLIGEQLGTPVSPAIEGFVNGKRFIKIKVMVQIDKPLKDRVKLGHPFLGELTMLCCVEKITRVCRFCGLLGHEMPQCPDHQRLTVLAQDPQTRARFPDPNFLAPKFGPWLTNPLLIPKAEGGAINFSHKRAYPTEAQNSASSGASLRQPTNRSQVNSLIISPNLEANLNKLLY